jgi:hypothetical protein
MHYERQLISTQAKTEFQNQGGETGGGTTGVPFLPFVLTAITVTTAAPPPISRIAGHGRGAAYVLGTSATGDTITPSTTVPA